MDQSCRAFLLERLDRGCSPVAVSAWRALFDTAELTAGQTGLIHGAAGGVGTFVVQLAKYRGAQVIGTSSAYNLIDSLVIFIGGLVTFATRS